MGNEVISYNNRGFSKYIVAMPHYVKYLIDYMVIVE